MNRFSRTSIQACLQPLSDAPSAHAGNEVQLREWFGIKQFREAAVLIGLVERAGEWQVLLTLRTDGLRNHGGQVSFPGGRRESGDVDPRATALRETREELGIAAAFIEPLGQLQPLATISGFRVVPVVAVMDPGYLAVPDPAEVADIFEVPLEALLDTHHQAEVQVRIGNQTRGVLEYCLPSEVSPYRIWGATAMMLDMLRQKLDTP